MKIFPLKPLSLLDNAECMLKIMSSEPIKKMYIKPATKVIPPGELFVHKSKIHRNSKGIRCIINQKAYTLLEYLEGKFNK